MGLGLLGLGRGFGFGRLTNLNRFSMHAVYRNRLVRAFLGTARPHDGRRPDGYTSFDPEDDIRVWDTFTHPRTAALYPVINVALNRTSGKDTARAERKAAPCVITPRHCGSSTLAKGEGASVTTSGFAGGDKLSGPGDQKKGITLGTAMTLSGAAVSPNMGYNSSPLTAFVMTLFNVRLGAWLPNPGSARPWSGLIGLAGPRNAVPTMLKELAGISDDTGDFVYLSDGGHFDNLGLYEMLSRECGRIFVVDAGRDQNYGYADLGRLLERARIDMGVTIEFIGPLKFGVVKLDPQGAHAVIRYASGLPGELIYLKPWMPEDAPADLRAYQIENTDFPHDPTIDQFFTESDFESYRQLGDYLTKTLMDDAFAVERPDLTALKPVCSCGPICFLRTDEKEPKTLERLFDGVRALSAGPAPEPATISLLSAIRRTFDSKEVPPATAAALRALWWAAKGDLERAHHCVQLYAGDPCSLVHAHLHRRYGEHRQARTWYRRAGRTHSNLPVAEEWAVIVRQLLRLGPPGRVG